MQTYEVESWHFHWQFWSPKLCMGGPINFGWWAVVKEIDGERRVEMSRFQVVAKREGELIK